MKKLLMVLLLTFVSSCVLALAPEYMRNGECYLLIGHSDPKFRGVTRLNNPSGEAGGNPINKKLFDPLNSYGISVDLNRNVFVFSENKAPTFVMNPSWPLKRKLKKPGGVGLYGAHCDTRKSYHVNSENVTYNQAGRDVYTTTGPMGNRTGTSNNPTNVCWTWSGVVKPTIKKPSKWYFQKTSVKCHTNCIYTNGTNDAYWLHFVPVDGLGYGTIPNNSWWQSRDKDPHGRPGNIFYWDREYRKYTYYDLNKWNKPMGIWSASNPVFAQPAGVADNIHDTIVKRSRISACMNVVCVNGDIDQNFSAAPKYTSLALSSFGRMYLYSRTKSSNSDAVLRCNGSDVSSDPDIRGYLNDKTTQWVGVSAKSKSEDYIYLLGTKTIESWLKKFNITNSVNITSVAVSDQWWLDGGIVYAYDGTTGKAYQFIRLDKNGKNTCKTTPISMDLGKNLDAIKADGFGNLFFAKTTMTPKSYGSLGWGNFAYSNLTPYGALVYGRVYYNQKVYKTVFERPFGTTTDMQVGKVHIGNNIYYRNFQISASDATGMTPTNVSNFDKKPSWVWTSHLVLRKSVTDPNLCQLGVINVNTPPNLVKPNGKLGVVDIVGVEDLGIDPKTTDVKQGLYSLRIENAPYWSGRTNITTPGATKWEGDANSNGTEGGFVSSLMNTSSYVDTSPQVKYTWKIYKLQDAFGNIIPAANRLVKTSADTQSNKISYYFRAGTYEILCSAKFKWYDFNSLPFGSTVNDLDSTIRPTTGYQIASAAPADPSFNSSNYPGFVTVPPNNAVYILKVNLQSKPPSGTSVPIEKLSSSNKWEGPKTYGSSVYHSVWEKEVHKWRVDTSKLKWVYQLPNITDSNMVPNSLAWQNNLPVQFEWTFNLTLPDGTVYPDKEFSKQSWTKTDGFNEVNFSLDSPTDPVMGNFTVKIYRIWEYQQNQYDEAGNYIGQKNVTGKVQYHGEVDVLVKDSTPPKVIAINGHSIVNNGPLDPAYLGNTYGLVTDKISYNGYTNPASFSILVEDNNLYANMDPTANVAPSDKLHDRKTKQAATFFFERGSGKNMCPSTTTGPVYKRYTSPSPSVVADIVNNGWATTPKYKLMREPLPYKVGDTKSYVLYVLNVADWIDLQDGTNPPDMNYRKRFPIDFANNSTNYSSNGHPGYGLYLTAVDSSGNVSVQTHLGNVWVKDTMLPLPYAEITDYIKSFAEEQPFGITSYLTTNPADSNDKNFPWYGKLPNGAALWTPGADGKYPGCTGLLGIPFSLNKKMSIYHPPIVQQGMELNLEVKARDNIGLSGIPSMVMKGPTGLYKENGATPINENAGADQKMRVMLQDSGVYNVTIKATDNALGFDGKASYNTREIHFGIVVGPTTMEIRTIDKSNENF